MITNLEEDYGHNPFTPSAPDVQSMFLALQNTLDMKFSFLSQKMDVMSEKVTSIEKKQCAIDTELKPHSCPSTPSSSSSITPVRKRLTPVALQVIILLVDILSTRSIFRVK